MRLCTIEKNGGGASDKNTVRMVVKHHHTGNSTSGGGCYTEQVSTQCGAHINWGSQYVSGSGNNIYYYGRDGTCTNGHSQHASGSAATGQTAPNLGYQPCRYTITSYGLPEGHPEEGEVVRNIDILLNTQIEDGTLDTTENEIISMATLTNT